MSDTSSIQICQICGYIYDPEAGDPNTGVAAGTAFDALPEDWFCPDCGAGKDDFGHRISILCSALGAFARLIPDQIR